MLHTKDIQNIDELQAFLAKPQKTMDIIMGYLDYFRFGPLSRSFDAVKRKGYPASQLLKVLICLPFFDKATIYALLRSGLAHLSEAQKDAYYALKNNVAICWRAFLWKFIGKWAKTIEESTPPAAGQGARCLVVDDSDIEKRGKKIEQVSRIWDHVRGRAILGFKLLVLGYYDGKSFAPVDFSLHKEKGRNKKLPYGLKKSQLKQQFRKERPVGSPALARVKECSQGKRQVAIHMVRRAVKRLPVDYLLMDSWFTCHEIIPAAVGCKVHLIGMMKMGKTSYQVGEQRLNAQQLIRGNKKVKRCRKHKLYYFAQRAHYKGNELQLLFSRQGTKGKWHLIVTTDLGLSFLKALEIYQVRWTIEVFFKESKQHLNLEGCPSNDFDAHIAHITLCMVQYLLLSLKKRIEHYQTHGALYDHLAERILQVTLWQRIWHLFLGALLQIAQMFGIDPYEFILELIHHKKIQYLLIAYHQLPQKIEKSENKYP